MSTLSERYPRAIGTYKEDNNDDNWIPSVRLLRLEKEIDRRLELDPCWYGTRAHCSYEHEIKRMKRLVQEGDKSEWLGNKIGG